MINSCTKDNKKTKNPNPKSPKTELIFLPYLSEIGPLKTCPIENPIRNIDKDNSIFQYSSNAFAISELMEDMYPHQLEQLKIKLRVK